MNCENFIADDVLDARIAYSQQTLDSKQHAKVVISYRKQ